VISRRLIPEHVRSGPSFRLPQVIVPEEGISFRDVITGFEKRLIESSLKTSGGVQKKAAQLLGLKPTTLNEMIKRYNILLPRDRDRERRPREVEEPTEKPTPA
jgi:transcriptional regulator with GAF, ATPase, and Fis domain